MIWAIYFPLVSITTVFFINFAVAAFALQKAHLLHVVPAWHLTFFVKKAGFIFTAFNILLVTGITGFYISGHVATAFGATITTIALNLLACAFLFARLHWSLIATFQEKLTNLGFILVMALLTVNCILFPPGTLSLYYFLAPQSQWNNSWQILLTDLILVCFCLPTLIILLASLRHLSGLFHSYMQLSNQMESAEKPKGKPKRKRKRLILDNPEPNIDYSKLSGQPAPQIDPDYFDHLESDTNQST